MNDTIVHAGPKRMKRSWHRTVVNLLVLGALIALACWLWGCVHGAAMPVLRAGHSGASMGPMLAMVQMNLAVVELVIVLLLGLGLIFLAERRDRQNHQSGNLPASLHVLAPEDPLELPAIGMTREELLRIFAALIFDLCEAQDMVRKAAANLGVEDYGDRLKGAERRLHGAVMCLGRLLELAGKMGGVEMCVRGYSAPAASHRPAHGGYVS